MVAGNSCSSTMTKHVNKISTSLQKGPFYKKVKVNGMEARGFVDLGSECSLITRQAIEQLRLTLELMNEPIYLELQ